MDKENSKIVITGGGSGGHTMTAVSVAEELVKRRPSIKRQLVFIGGSLTMEGEKGKTSIEERVVTEKGFKFVRIRSGKLQRRLSLRTIKLLFGVIGGLIDSWRFFSNNKVSLVFSSGGYVTVPVCLVAWLKKIPIVIHEQTSRVGLSNKITSKFAKKILVGFEDAKKFLPKSKTFFTGNTIRDIFINPWDEENCPGKIKVRLEEFKNRSEKYPVILICGGGQGSHLINKTVRVALKNLLTYFQLIVITGDNKLYKDYEKFEITLKKLSQDSQDRIILTRFAAKELGAYFDVADLFVGRSGALFLSEVGFTKTPAILIPIPWVTHNEQYFNAKVLEKLGIATILPQGELSPEILVQKIQKMIKKIRSGKINLENVDTSSTFPSDAAKKIADNLLSFL